LREHLGPWTVNGPARWVARQALADRAWQNTTREILNGASRRLADYLSRHGLTPTGGTALFQWRLQNDARFLQDALAKQGILVRRFSDPAGLRLGLPAGEAAWRRLDLALSGARRLNQCDEEK
jgi:cobalamin biosynthetic protein CobC